MRTVSLILIDPAGVVLGALPPFEVRSPWWPEVAEIAERTGVQVLRLLHADRPAQPGGHVTYLAETSSPAVGTTPVEIDRNPQPFRAPYAEVGGPTATITWAKHQLGQAVHPRQRRTWNLSAIWRLDGDDGQPVAWIKQVPSFFAHEPHAIGLVDAVRPGLVPPLLAAGDQGRMLLGHIPGEDCFGASEDVCRRIAEAFHPVQAHFATRTTELAGIPDRRRPDLAFADGYRARIPGLGALLDDLPRRLAAIDACRVPDTLVHGDLHSGNVRIEGDRLTIMDWGDCCVGHPAFDVLRLTDRLERADRVLEEWARRWELSVPGSEPRRAAELMRPVAALILAESYARFLARIEPAEHPYHAADVPEQLTAAVALAAA